MFWLTLVASNKNDADKKHKKTRFLRFPPEKKAPDETPSFWPKKGLKQRFWGSKQGFWRVRKGALRDVQKSKKTRFLLTQQHFIVVVISVNVIL